MTPVRVLFAGGGTSGHLTPCLAVAQSLLERRPEAKMTFVVSRRPADAAMMSARGLDYHPIFGTGMPYGISPATVLSLAHLGVGCIQAMGIIRQVRPQVLFATGGFISAATVLAARTLRVPVMMHACDAMPDRTNRLLARWADLMSVVSDEAGALLAARHVVVTGQPVRPEVLKADSRQARKSLGIPPSAFVVLVTGGSQGAETLNRATTGALPNLLEDPNLHVIHLTGAGKLPDLSQLHTLGLPAERYLVQEHRSDMSTLLAASDVVVTRAGASSLAEASAWGRPMIVVPYPYAGGHQHHNARLYERAGAAWIVEDSDFDAPRLVGLINRLRETPCTLHTMSQAAFSMETRNAAGKITEQLLTLLPPS